MRLIVCQTLAYSFGGREQSFKHVLVSFLLEHLLVRHLFKRLPNTFYIAKCGLIFFGDQNEFVALHVG